MTADPKTASPPSGPHPNRSAMNANKLTDFPVDRPHENCYWVVPGRFLAGEYPGAYRPTGAYLRLQAYLRAGISSFLDLTHPNDGLAPYAAILADAGKVLNVPTDYRRLPIPDMSVPSHAQMVAILDTIDAALAGGARIYVHCWGGIGRTGTVVGCYLVRHGLTGNAALAQLATWWQGVEKSSRNPRSPETDAQVAMIRQWAE
ncbi:MAG: dual specificity protein phosphatase family protein [Caldilineaceae bacterium]|nr:dual specificity protein phosphatase family protein [Caldilineaceae bacterium]